MSEIVANWQIEKRFFESQARREGFKTMKEFYEHYHLEEFYEKYYSKEEERK